MAWTIFIVLSGFCPETPAPAFLRLNSRNHYVAAAPYVAPFQGQ
jgi:hypothetical protein